MFLWSTGTIIDGSFTQENPSAEHFCGYKLIFMQNRDHDILNYKPVILL